jgi:3-hydroxybutyryl-CoA dehydrogenase
MRDWFVARNARRQHRENRPMPFDPNAADVTVGVVGTGSMGRGIMQVSAQGRMRVVAFDEKPGAAEAAKAYIGTMLERAVAKGSIPDAEAKAALARIMVAGTLEDVARANVIVEAIVERLDVKQALFARLDALAGPDTIIASNTSSIPITAIASACKAPERVGGMHFFNPVPLMRLVEVIPGLKTAPWVTEAMMTIGRRMTREPVLCTDSPAFLVNHVGRAFVPEAQRILTENIATVAEIDRILTGAPGFRLGPFSLADLVGIDVQHGVMESVYALFYGEPMFAPFPVSAQRVAGGLYGQKTGAGWYRYEDGKKVEPPRRPVPTARPKSVWLSPSKNHPELQAPLLELLAQMGAKVETGAAPSADALILLTQIGWDLTTAIVDLKLDARRTVALDILFGLKGPRTLMVTPATDPAVRDAAHSLLAADGQEVIVINDSPGFIAQRVVAMIVNVACGVAQRAIATPADIGKGTKLGLGYPFGPLEWGDRIGAGRVLFILERLHAFYGEPRYRPSPWLKRRVALGLPLSAPEGLR